MPPLFSLSEDAEVDSEFSVILNSGLVAARRQEPKRNYLGASRWGEECERRLGYEYGGSEEMEDRRFKGETYRIFDMGHDGESRMAEYMRLAGFQLFTVKEDGSQWGFTAAPHPETGVPRLKGHIDGGIKDGPAFKAIYWNGAKNEFTTVLYPCLWEQKTLGAKSFNSVIKKGIKKAKPVYYAQVQVYCAQLNLPNGCLFTCLHRDTAEVYAEWISFDPIAAQEAIDRAVRVISAADPRELPRVTSDPSDYRCRFCPHAERCWQETAVGGSVETPGWLFGS